MGVTHAKVSAISDGANTNLVRPTDWNAGHVTTGDIDLSVTTSLTTSEGRTGWNDTTDRLLVYDGQRERGVGDVGWVPWAVPMNWQSNFQGTISSLTITANGGTILLPMSVRGQMLLQSVSISQQSTSLARQWGWDLYLQDLNNGNAGENTLRRVADSNGDDSFTPGAASIRTLDVASAPVYLVPGIYWLAVQCTHATNAIGLGNFTASSSIINTAQTKTTTNPNGATIDAVTATWTKVNDVYLVAMKGRAFGETTAF